MKKTVRRIIAAALTAVCVFTSAAPAYAHGHGKGGSHHGEEEKHCGWTEIDGHCYYYNEDGTCVNKDCVIDGVFYCFDSDGVCEGPYTGWARCGKKKFYYRDGLREYGWVNVKGRERSVKAIFPMHYYGDWYYIDKKKGRLTGEQVIDGFTYKFDSKGRWDADGFFTDEDGSRADCTTVVFWVRDNMDKKMYGDVTNRDGMCIVWSVDGKAEAVIKEQLPNAKCVVYKKADYSMRQLQKAQNYLAKPGIWELCSGGYIRDNRLVVWSPTETIDKLRAYVDTLPCKDMIVIIEGEWTINLEAAYDG